MKQQAKPDPGLGKIDQAGDRAHAVPLRHVTHTDLFRTMSNSFNPEDFMFRVSLS